MTDTIVLITDFGTKDPYAAVMKGVLLSKNRNLNIVDGTHDISPQDIGEASRFLDSIIKWYPPATVFLCVVDPGVGSSRKILVLKSNNCLIAAPDNGVLSDIIRNSVPEELYWVCLDSRPSNSTFDGRDFFAPLGAELAQKGTNLACLKNISLDQIIVKDFYLKPEFSENIISGQVVNIDIFGNLITNISKSDALNNFSTILNIKAFIDEYEIGNVFHTYSSLPEGSLTAIWNSSGFLEIACVNGSARKKLGDLSENKIYLKFFE